MISRLISIYHANLFFLVHLLKYFLLGIYQKSLVCWPLGGFDTPERENYEMNVSNVIIGIIIDGNYFYLACLICPSCVLCIEGII